MKKLLAMDTTHRLHAQDAYHYALAAAGGVVDGMVTNKRTPSTRTQFIIAACAEAKLAGLQLKRPRGPVDAPDFAREVLRQCRELGVDANTGTPIVEAPAAPEPTITDEEPAPVSELVPSRGHRCTAGSYCRVCLVDAAA